MKLFELDLQEYNFLNYVDLESHEELVQLERHKVTIVLQNSGQFILLQIVIFFCYTLDKLQ